MSVFHTVDLTLPGAGQIGQVRTGDEGLHLVNALNELPAATRIQLAHYVIEHQDRRFAALALGQLKFRQL